MATKKKLLQAAAGQAGGGGLNVEDVFSTYLYTGDSSTGQTITNGIDLAGEGGMVWFKTRSSANGHNIYDTERGDGVLQYITSEASITNSTNPWSPTSTGFFTGRDFGGSENQDGSTTASWTFRKAPKFFTVVTYTGDGTSDRQISHDLGGTVGHIAVKRTDTSAEFFNWHRTFSDNQLVAFTGTYAVGTYSNYLVTADSTTFTVGNNVDVNANGGTYVAYLWGHNDGDGDFGPDGDADIISCGSYTGSGSAGKEITLGWEPQWLLIKKTSAARDWVMFDNMRGMFSDASSTGVPHLHPNSSVAESSVYQVYPTATGFVLNTGASDVNGSDTYIYIAIRRGPMAVPEDATDVFAVTTQSGSTAPAHDTGFVTDFSLRRENAVSSASVMHAVDRLRGKYYLQTNGTNAETGLANNTWDFMDGWFGAGSDDSNKYAWSWKRSPNYFDIVAYTGNGVAGRTVSHNLGVSPEMMWVKRRNLSNNWNVYHKDLDATAPEQKYMRLNTTDGILDATNRWNDTAPTSSDFTVGTSTRTNSSGDTFIAYLFASLDGVSKVGSFTTAGSDVDVDCGFSAGPRFVLIKNTASGNWFVMDTERGITSGTDPFLTLNTTNAESSALDLIDINPTSTGFTVNQGSFGNGTFIFYAIA